MDSADALDRMATLLRPGGTLAIVGLARNRYLADAPLAIVGAITSRIHRLPKTAWEHSAPTVWPLPETFGQTRRIAKRIVPGAHYRRHMLWRCSLIWTKPTP